MGIILYTLISLAYFSLIFLGSPFPAEILTSSIPPGKVPFPGRRATGSAQSAFNQERTAGQRSIKGLYSVTDPHHGYSQLHKGRSKRQCSRTEMPLRSVRRSHDGRLLPLHKKPGGRRRNAVGRLLQVLPSSARIHLSGGGRTLFMDKDDHGKGMPDVPPKKECIHHAGGSGG